MASLRDFVMKTLKLTSGATVNEFSTDGTLGGNSDSAVPTEKAVKTYVDAAGGTMVAVTGTFNDGDLNGSDQLVITRGAAGDQYPASIMLYDENDDQVLPDFDPTSTTVTTIEMAAEVSADGGTLTGTWNYRLLFAS